MVAKMRLKTKGVEFEWEGEVEFLKTEVPDLIAALIDAIGQRVTEPDEGEGAEQIDASNHSAQNKTFTTSSLAARVQPATAAELVKVALAKLQISDGIEPASRKQIHDEMKTAPKYYRPSMGSNLTKTIDGLLAQGEINEPSNGHFALSHDAQQKFSEKV